MRTADYRPLEKPLSPSGQGRWIISTLGLQNRPPQPVKIVPGQLLDFPVHRPHGRFPIAGSGAAIAVALNSVDVFRRNANVSGHGLEAVPPSVGRLRPCIRDPGPTANLGTDLLTDVLGTATGRGQCRAWDDEQVAIRLALCLQQRIR